MCVCVCIILLTTQSGPVILVILCHSRCYENLCVSLCVFACGGGGCCDPRLVGVPAGVTRKVTRDFFSTFLPRYLP